MARKAAFFGCFSSIRHTGQRSGESHYAPDAVRFSSAAARHPTTGYRPWHLTDFTGRKVHPGAIKTRPVNSGRHIARGKSGEGTQKRFWRGLRTAHPDSPQEEIIRPG